MIKQEKGSITIEAALLIPIFLFFILLLTSLVKIGIAEISLQKAVDETVQSSAHYAYIGFAAQNLLSDTGSFFEGAIVDGAQESIGDDTIAKYLIEKIADVATAGIPSSGDIFNYFTDSYFEGAVRKKYDEYVSSSDFYNPTSMKVTSSYPTGNSGDDADLVIEAEVTLKIVLPFLEQDLKIKKIGVERGWVGS